MHISIPKKRPSRNSEGLFFISKSKRLLEKKEQIIRETKIFQPGINQTGMPF